MPHDCVASRLSVEPAKGPAVSATTCIVCEQSLRTRYLITALPQSSLWKPEVGLQCQALHLSGAAMCEQDVEIAAERFGKEHPEAGLIAGDAWKVKAMVQGNEAIVIKLSDAQAAVSQEEPLNELEEACRR